MSTCLPLHYPILLQNGVLFSRSHALIMIFVPECHPVRGIWVVVLRSEGGLYSGTPSAVLPSGCVKEHSPQTGSLMWTKC